VGTPAVTTRGFKEEECEKVAEEVINKFAGGSFISPVSGQSKFASVSGFMIINSR
jgi:glycine/serine hydroxymethyltransferase